MKLLSYLHNKLLFTLQDVAIEMGNTRSAQALLMRYQRQGYISKVRRGLSNAQTAGLFKNCINNLIPI